MREVLKCEYCVTCTIHMLCIVFMIMDIYTEYMSAFVHLSEAVFFLITKSVKSSTETGKERQHIHKHTSACHIL